MNDGMVVEERAFAWIFYLTSYIPRNDNTRKIENSSSILLN